MNEGLGFLRIDKSSPVPMYHQISASIRQRILNNEWKPGDKIPSEEALSFEYGVSKITLRQALSNLEQEELIRKERGKGVFVNKNPKGIVHDLSLPIMIGWRLKNEGTPLDAKVLSCYECSAIPYINEALGAEPEESLIYVKRTFLLDNRAIALNRSWLRSKVVPGLAENGLIDSHLSTTLSTVYQLVPERLENTIECTKIYANDINILNVQYDTPVIIVTSVSYLECNVPLEYSKTIWLGDKVKFTFNMPK